MIRACWRWWFKENNSKKNAANLMNLITEFTNWAPPPSFSLTVWWPPAVNIRSADDQQTLSCLLTSLFSHETERETKALWNKKEWGRGGTTIPAVPWNHASQRTPLYQSSGAQTAPRKSGMSSDPSRPFSVSLTFERRKGSRGNVSGKRTDRLIPCVWFGGDGREPRKKGAVNIVVYQKWVQKINK